MSKFHNYVLGTSPIRKSQVWKGEENLHSFQNCTLLFEEQLREETKNVYLKIIKKWRDFWIKDSMLISFHSSFEMISSECGSSLESWSNFRLVSYISNLAFESTISDGTIYLLQFLLMVSRIRFRSESRKNVSCRGGYVKLKRWIPQSMLWYFESKWWTPRSSVATIEQNRSIRTLVLVNK